MKCPYWKECVIKRSIAMATVRIYCEDHWNKCITYKWMSNPSHRSSYH